MESIINCPRSASNSFYRGCNPQLAIAVALLLLAIGHQPVAAETNPPPEKLTERATRGTPKDREYIHGAVMTVKNWAATETDLRVAQGLREHFRRWSGDSYADLVRWIEIEQIFDAFSGDSLNHAVSLLAAWNQGTGICRIPPEFSSLDDYSSEIAGKIEVELLAPCENLPPDEATSALEAVVQPRRALARPKEVNSYISTHLKDRKLSAGLCQILRIPNIITGNWKGYDTCAQMLPAGPDRAGFIEGTALGLLDLNETGLALKSIERPWIGTREKPLLEFTRARIMAAQKKTSALTTAILKILKTAPLDSPELLWAAEEAPDAAVPALISRLDPIISGTAATNDDLSDAASALDALTRKRCPASGDQLQPFPECTLGKSLSSWRKILLDRYLSPDIQASTRRTIEQILHLLPTQAWKGTASAVCANDTKSDLTVSLRRGLTALCIRMAGPGEIPAVQERLKNSSHPEKMVILTNLAASGTDPKLREALQTDLEQVAISVQYPVSERRNAAIALFQTGCSGVPEIVRDVLERDPNPLIALIPRFTCSANSPKPDLRARFIDLPQSGVIYPAIRKSDGKEVFIVDNLKAEPVMKIETIVDYGPELLIGMENQTSNGDITGEARTLKLHRQSGSSEGNYIYASERYPSDFNDDGSLRRPPGGGGWTEF